MYVLSLLCFPSIQSIQSIFFAVFCQVKEKTVLAYLLKIPEVVGLSVAINIKEHGKNMARTGTHFLSTVMFFAKELDSVRAEVASAAALQREGKSQEKLFTERQTKDPKRPEIVETYFLVIV